MTTNLTLDNYFFEWMETFKKPAISSVTYVKYQNTHQHIKKYFGDIKFNKVTRQNYQTVLNRFAKTHAKRTTSGFHKQIRAAVIDALEEGIIDTDFTRKAIITGREKVKEKVMFHSYSEWQALIRATKISTNSYDFIIYLSAMTGLRFAEVLGLTVEDISFKNKLIIVNKTWDYKYHTGFKPTKNSSSVRTIDVDTKTLHVIKNMMRIRKFKKPQQKICENEDGRLPVSATINRHLEKLCTKLNISPISFHGLRHTHASILLFKDVNILSVSRRLGHKDVTTTQSVYLHIIKEMEERETKLIMRIMMKALSE
ncbi:site-specific integrase [Liquorilactobacillus hordei]|uniref:Integrase n=1 Tax=Liquorilactobacillus hordei DSM 19519 TaxID=1423759 RepID=A0A0R1MQJ9_9LACO|nr:site-specific integrase [Liquorilactobacillus hordei]KRL06120.1 integrase [Liquorilactobacillus hordei DSM 19519]QYH52386.1 site-specific integrase [Liquorilactobacillus hordei DSM 19519]